MPACWPRAVDTRTGEKCDPYIYYQRVRTPMSGWRNNPDLPQVRVLENENETPVCACVCVCAWQCGGAGAGGRAGWGPWGRQGVTAALPCDPAGCTFPYNAHMPWHSSSHTTGPAA
jgi:hypothetical protein